LLEKDYSAAVRSGFEATGIYPLSLQMALSRLPVEPQETESAIQRLLLQRLSDMRYNPPATTQAKRPRKKDKLPAGSAYTCAAEPTVVDSSSDEETPAPAAKKKKASSSSAAARKRKDSSSSDSSFYEDEEDEKRSRAVKKIVKRGGSKKRSLPTSRSRGGDQPAQDQPDQDFHPGSYIICVYQEDWYLGQIMSKEGEPVAVEGDQYLLVNFMCQCSASPPAQGLLSHQNFCDHQL
jgi:hypothetical protein